MAVDPYERAKWWMHIRYNTIWAIWSDMLFFIAISIAVVFADKMKAGLDLGIAPTMLTVLGTVLGFCISYRTSSAYERYIEGRKLWQQVQVATRAASRLIWFHVPSQTKPELEEGQEKAEDAVRALIEKKTMLRLLEAFAVALKHYLRGESGIHYQDRKRSPRSPLVYPTESRLLSVPPCPIPAQGKPAWLLEQRNTC